MNGAQAPRPQRRSGHALAGLGWAVVAAGVLLRFVHLDADPHYYGWWGYLFDEGRWVEQARRFALTGALPSEFGRNALVAPLYEASTTVGFVIAGVSRWTARLFPALCGSALVVLVFTWLRARVSPSAALLGVALVAFPADLVVLSRIAAPETPAMLATTLAFMALVSGRPTRGRLLLAGVLTAAAIGVKLTTLFVALIFPFVALTLRPPGSGLRARAGDAFWFCVGLGAPALIGASIGAMLALSAGLDLWTRLQVFTQFFGVRAPYSLVGIPFLAIDASVIVPSCLALWAAGLAWLGAADRRAEDLRFIRATATWAVAYVAVFMVQLYFPERYRVHVLVPLALLAAHAVSRLERDGLGGVAARIAATRPLVRLGITAFVVLPASLQGAALLNAVAGTVGLDPERLTTRLIVTVVSWAGASAALVRVIDRRRVLEWLVAFSIVATVAQLAHWAMRPFDVAFCLESPGALPLRLVIVFGCALVATVTTRSAAWRAVAAAPAVIVAAVVIVAWTAHLWEGLARPKFTARDASIEMGRLLATDVDVEQFRAEGLFVDNQIRYAIIEGLRDRSALPAVVVVELPPQFGEKVLRDRYRLAEHFELYVPAGHSLPPLVSGVCDGPGQCFGIFRLRDAPSPP